MQYGPPRYTILRLIKTGKLINTVNISILCIKGVLNGCCIIRNSTEFSLHCKCMCMYISVVYIKYKLYLFNSLSGRYMR